MRSTRPRGALNTLVGREPAGAHSATVIFDTRGSTYVPVVTAVVTESSQFCASILRVKWH